MMIAFVVCAKSHLMPVLLSIIGFFHTCATLLLAGFFTFSEQRIPSLLEHYNQEHFCVSLVRLPFLSSDIMIE